MEDYRVERIEMTEAAAKLLGHFHYLKTRPSGVQHVFGLFNEASELIGVATFGRFSRLQSQEKYVGCLELSRLYAVDEAPKNTESFFLGACLRWLKKHTDIGGVISYADPTEGHQGTIYRAANFKEIGKTRPSYHYEDKEGGRVHKRQVWGRSRDGGLSEGLQAEFEGLRRVPEIGKKIFMFELKSRKSPVLSIVSQPILPATKPVCKKLRLAQEVVKGHSHSVGIYKVKNGRFRLCIIVKRRQIHMGYFDSKESAESFFKKEISKIETQSN